MKKYPILFVLGIAFSATELVSAQAVTEIVSDFNGYWKSGARPNVNGVHPNNSHNLLSFTYNSIRYSTGVNDATLTGNGLSFTPGNYRALPINGLATAPTTATYIGLGQMYDGVAGASNPPPANNIPFYLTDGINGLNLGTAVYNLPSSNLFFEIGLFNIARLGDGIPDILITQMGDISASTKDTLKFIDPSGNLVGSSVAVTFAGADTLGLIDNDFYNAWQNPMGFATGFYPSNTKRALRVFAFDLSEFGLNSSNFASIDKFVMRLSGQSDQAFVAYNTAAIQILPNSNPGCFTTLPGLWLKANDGTSTITNNQKLSSWEDRSANVFSLSQSTASNQPQFKDPTNSFNYNAFLNFDASNRLLSANSPFATPESNADIFIVGRPTATTGLNKILGFSRNASDAVGTGAGDFPSFSYDASGRLSIDSGSVNLLTSGSANVNKIVLQQINYKQGAGAAITISTNGSTDGSVALSRRFGRWTMQVGDMSPGNDQSDLDLAEVIVFPENLSAAERIKVESYLSIKYGLTSAHDYVSGGGVTTWAIASNTGYNNNIFGIGREDCQAMHRKQSKSSNADALVTIGNVAIAVDNISNFNLMNNNAFSIMGDNAGALVWQSTEAPASCYQRIGREWKVRETGTVGALHLRVPASTSSAGVKLPLASNQVYLLIDNDGNFSTGLITVIPMTMIGTNWEAYYNFADGNYYTFATDNGIATDFNDLPAPWPAAVATLNACNTNGDAIISLADQNGARVGAWAGNAITAEGTALAGPTASLDAGDDGLQIPAPLNRHANNVFTIRLNGNVNNTTVHYRLWIDWNINGNFGDDVDGNGARATYAGSATVNGVSATNVSVNVLPPLGLVNDFTVRLIVSAAAIDEQYTATPAFVYNIVNGEVEDYYFPTTALPVVLRQFRATRSDCKASLNWLSANEENFQSFVIERSNGTGAFEIMKEVPATGGAAGTNYQYIDETESGFYNYRLKLIDRDGRFIYSNTLQVNPICSKVKMSVSPNPFQGSVLVRNLPAGARLQVHDMTGRLLAEQRTRQGDNIMKLDRIISGTYVLSVRHDNLVIFQQKIVSGNK